MNAKAVKKSPGQDRRTADGEKRHSEGQGDPPARFVLTDEPYNVPISGHVTGGAHREFAMASGEMTDAEFPAFNQAWMAVGYNGFQ